MTANAIRMTDWLISVEGTPEEAKARADLIEELRG